MADNTIAVLNLGSQSISLGVFDASKSGLSLKKYATESILADPANEAIRLAQVQGAIQSLADQLGVSSSKVVFSVSGQSVFTRFVKLPSLGDDNIEQLVSFEAQQHIPFPINDVAWDWEMIDSSGMEKEVAIVAIKKDLLNEVDKSVSETGMTTVNVESSPIALTNAFYHSYPGVNETCLLYTSPSPRDGATSRMPSSA